MADPSATIDPRIAHTQRVVRTAALEELAEVGYGNLSIEGVAARAKVAKSTIYRHWDGKASLLIDALDAVNQQPAPDSPDGTARSNVLTLLHHLVVAMTDPVLSSTLTALVDAAERNPEIARLHHQSNDRRRAALETAICDGIEGGEFPSDLDPELAALSLAGAIIYRRLLTDDPFPPDLVDELVAVVVGPVNGPAVEPGRPATDDKET